MKRSGLRGPLNDCSRAARRRTGGPGRRHRPGLPADRVDAIVQAYREEVRPIHTEAAGLRQHYVLVNRQTGRIEIIGVWESADDIAAIASVLEPARQRLWSEFGADPPLEYFEVADHLW